VSAEPQGVDEVLSARPKTVVLPAPTAAPLVLAFGATLLTAGLVTHMAISVTGACHTVQRLCPSGPRLETQASPPLSMSSANRPLVAAGTTSVVCSTPSPLESIQVSQTKALLTQWPRMAPAGTAISPTNR